MLREDFLPDYGLTTAGLAGALGVSRQTVNELLRERRSVSPEMALRLSRLFCNSPEFWLNAQRAVDLWDAERQVAHAIRRIKPLSAAYYRSPGPDSSGIMKNSLTRSRRLPNTTPAHSGTSAATA
jgi:addiction module HigA family antidote